MSFFDLQPDEQMGRWAISQTPEMATCSETAPRRVTGPKPHLDQCHTSLYTPPNRSPLNMHWKQFLFGDHVMTINTSSCSFRKSWTRCTYQETRWTRCADRRPKPCYMLDLYIYTYIYTTRTLKTPWLLVWLFWLLVWLFRVLVGFYIYNIYIYIYYIVCRSLRSRPAALFRTEHGSRQLPSLLSLLCWSL